MDLAELHPPGSDYSFMNKTRINRDYYLSMSGEHEPCENSWSGSRLINEPYVQTVEYDRQLTRPRSRATSIVIEVRASKRRIGSAKRSSSYDYWTRLRMGGMEMILGAPKRARSLVEIERQVDAMDIPEEIAAIQKRFYAQRTSICVYVENEGQWIPFCSAFDLSDRPSQLPRGKYLEIAIDSRGPGGYHVWVMKVSAGGYCGDSRRDAISERGWFPDAWYAGS